MNTNSLTRMILLEVIIMITVISLESSVSVGSDHVQKFIEYVSPGNDFKCSIPADWSVYDPVFGLSAEEKKVYGVTLFGPKTGNPVSPVISIHYYAPGNLLHKTMERFIRLHSEPVFDIPSDGKYYSEVRKITIAGRESRAFERKDIQFIGKREINPLRMVVSEKFIVIPARQVEGFYVLKFSVPDEIKNTYTGIFEESVKSFLPSR